MAVNTLEPDMSLRSGGRTGSVLSIGAPDSWTSRWIWEERGHQTGSGVAITLTAGTQPRLAALEEKVQRLQETINSLEFLVVDGYIGKVWQDAESDAWRGVCPTVRCVAQEDTREEAIAGHAGVGTRDVGGAGATGNGTATKGHPVGRCLDSGTCLAGR